MNQNQIVNVLDNIENTLLNAGVYNGANGTTAQIERFKDEYGITIQAVFDNKNELVNNGFNEEYIVELNNLKDEILKGKPGRMLIHAFLKNWQGKYLKLS